MGAEVPRGCHWRDFHCVTDHVRRLLPSKKQLDGFLAIFESCALDRANCSQVEVSGNYNS